MKIILVAIGFVIVAASHLAAQQPPVNPTTVEFEHVDFDGVDRYVLGYFSSPTAPAPVQEADLPKPATCAPCTGPLVSRPTGFATWYVGVRAVAGTVSSPWSAPLVPFARAPLAPTSVTVR